MTSRIPPVPPQVREWVKLVITVLAVAAFVANAAIKRDVESLGWLLLVVLWAL